MKKVLISLGFAALVLGATAQVKIKDGTVTGSSTTPNPNAILELESNNKGLLYPRVQLTATNQPLISSGAMVAGMLVYNTATVTGTNGVTPGVYYNNGTNWIRFVDTAAWNLTGNAGTTAGVNFVGTTDAQDLVFKTNNVQAGWLNAPNNNTAFGAHSLAMTATGIENTGIGAYALAGTTGSYNTAIGAGALYPNTTGSQNTAVGRSTLYNIGNGNDNTALGFNAGVTQTAGSNNIVIGSQQNLANAAGSNQMNIGGVIFGTGLSNTGGTGGSVGINTAAPNSVLQVNGSLTMPVTVYPGSGTLTADSTMFTILFYLNPSSPTLSLPDASTCVGRMYRIVNESGYIINVTTLNPTNKSIWTINGASGSSAVGQSYTQILSPGGANNTILIQSFGNGFWHKVGL